MFSQNMSRSVSGQPILYAPSVMGVRFDNGVVIAVDTLTSFYSTAKFLNCERIIKVNNNIIAGFSGEFADIQYITNLIELKQIEEETHGDNIQLSPRSLYSWLTRLQYNRRSRIEPLLTSWVVGGLDQGTPFLGYVDKLGTAFEDQVICTDFGLYINACIRDKIYKNPNITKDEAIELIKEGMFALCNTDSRSYRKYKLAVLDKTGVSITGPYEIPVYTLSGRT